MVAQTLLGEIPLYKYTNPIGKSLSEWDEQPCSSSLHISVLIYLTFFLGQICIYPRSKPHWCLTPVAFKGMAHILMSLLKTEGESSVLKILLLCTCLCMRWHVHMCMKCIWKAEGNFCFSLLPVCRLWGSNSYIRLVQQSSYWTTSLASLYFFKPHCTHKLKLPFTQFPLSL